MPTATKKRRGKASVEEQELDHLRKCLNDLEFYARHHVRIRTKKAQLLPLRLTQAQKIVHRKIADQLQRTGRVRVVILKARQEGISTYTAARFFRKVHLFPNQKAVVLAHEKDKSSEIFEMYDRIYKNLMPEIKPDKLSTQKGNLLHLANDSQIQVETAMDEDAGASATIQLLHGSEVARWPNAEEVYTSIYQTIPDVASEVILESTAKGVGNMFHQIWDEAYEGHGVTEGSNGFLAIFLPWWIHEEYRVDVSEDERLEIVASNDPYEREAQDVGLEYEGELHKLTVEQLAWRRRIGIPEKCRGNLRKFHQEYPSNPEEAFIASGDTFFDKDALEDYKKRVARKRNAKRFTLIHKNDTILPRRDDLGHLRIWHMPEPEGIYVIGADCATGKSVTTDLDNEMGGRDFSCADVLQVNIAKGRTRVRQVAQLHGRMPPDVFAKHLVNLGYFYRTALIGPERNHSAGETVVQKVYDEYAYPNTYVARQVNTRRDGAVTSRWGWWTTKVTRPILLDELAEALRNGWLDINCPETIREMFTFILDERGIPRAIDGRHDDRVMSLGITYQLATTTHQAPPKGQLPETEVFETSVSGAFDYGWR